MGTVSVEPQGPVRPEDSEHATPGYPASQPQPGGPQLGPPQYAQPQYAQPQYAQAPYGQPQASTDGMSIAALVTGILGLGVVPIVLGVLGMKRTKANGTKGRGFSIAGIVLGGLGILTSIALVAMVVLGAIGAGVTTQAISDAVNAPAPTVASEVPTEASGLPTDVAGGASDSATPLRDVTQLTVAGFTADALATDSAVTALGATEAYTATYSDGTSAVATVLNNWPTPEQGQAWAAVQSAQFTAEQLVDSGTPADGVAYKFYLVGDVATVVVTDQTAAFTLTGPSDAVSALSAEYQF